MRLCNRCWVTICRSYSLAHLMLVSYVKYLCAVIFWDHAVPHLVEALGYKLECRGFDSRWCHWNFSLTYSFRSHYGPGVDSASNRNEYQEYFPRSKGGRCIGLSTLPPSCADCLEIVESQTPGTLRACPGLYRDFYTNYMLFSA
jgi:hypothetical protein